MRRVRICLMTIMLLVSLCACGNSSENEKDNRKDEPEVEIVLTSEEEELLIKSFYMDEEDKLRMQEGKLYGSEEKCILNSRATLQYLEEKYPGVKFTIVSYESPSFLGSSDPIIDYMDDSGSDKIYTMRLMEDANGEIVFEDDYYGTSVQGRYDKYLMELLKENGFGDCITYTEITGNYGMEVNGDISVEEILNRDISKNSRVFVEGNSADGESIAKAVEELIREEAIYGSYQVYVLEDIDSISSDAKELLEYARANEEKVTKRTFNTWTEMKE